MPSVNSKLQVLEGNTYLGGKFDAFLMFFFCILGVFLEEFEILAGDSPGDSWK